MEKIYHKLTIEAPASEVYEKLTDVEMLKTWLANKTSGEAAKVGGVIQYGDENFNHKCEVINLKANKKVEWKITEMNSPMTDYKVWIGTTNEYELEEKKLERLGGKTVTILLFKHAGWPKGSGETKAFAECNWYWAYLLLSLKNVCEGKAGMAV